MPTLKNAEPSNEDKRTREREQKHELDARELEEVVGGYGLTGPTPPR